MFAQLAEQPDQSTGEKANPEINLRKFFGAVRQQQQRRSGALQKNVRRTNRRKDQNSDFNRSVPSVSPHFRIYALSLVVLR